MQGCEICSLTVTSVNLSFIQSSVHKPQHSSLLGPILAQIGLIRAQNLATIYITILHKSSPTHQNILLGPPYKKDIIFCTQKKPTIREIGQFRICLRFAYFIETAKLFIESTIDKSKSQLKQYSGTHKQYQKVS